MIRIATLTLLLATPLTAAGEPTADDLAVLAAEVHQQHCAEIYGGDIDLAAEGYSAVAPVWQQVNLAYDEGQHSFLLYWRGLLAQCLGQAEQAAADLQAFVTAEEGTGNLEAMVRDANRRLRWLRVQQDEDEAREELGGYEFLRYRRAGMALKDWRPRRHSMGQRLVLLVGIGAAHGAYRAQHVQAVTSEGDWITVDWLESDSYFLLQLGFEAWPGGAVGIGGAASLTGGEHAYTVSQVQDLSAATAPTDEDGAAQGGWVGASAWVVTTPLPRKPFKPLFRLGPRFRFAGDKKLDGTNIQTASWAMAALGVFAGLAYHPRTVMGVEVGVWFQGDLTSGSLVAGDTETAPPQLTQVGDHHDRVSIELVILMRFGL